MVYGFGKTRKIPQTTLTGSLVNPIADTAGRV